MADRILVVDDEVGSGEELDVPLVARVELAAGDFRRFGERLVVADVGDRCAFGFDAVAAQPKRQLRKKTKVLQVNH